MVTGYIQRHPDIVSYIEVVKNHRKKYTLREKRMAAKSYQEHENIKNKYSLDKEEIENIFDIIKEEQDISWNVSICIQNLEFPVIWKSVDNGWNTRMI